MNLEFKIKAKIEEKGIKLPEIAVAIDMSLQNLYKCFKRNSIETKHLEKIAEVLGVPVGYFFDENKTEVVINGNEVNGVVNNNGTVHFNNLHEAEKEISYLKDKLKEKDKLIDNLQRDKEFLQGLIKTK